MTKEISVCILNMDDKPLSQEQVEKIPELLRSVYVDTVKISWVVENFKDGHPELFKKLQSITCEDDVYQLLSDILQSIYGKLNQFNNVFVHLPIATNSERLKCEVYYMITENFRKFVNGEDGYPVFPVFSCYDKDGKFAGFTIGFSK
jgi:hypothetical protein